MINNLSNKGKKLIELYEKMAKDGYERNDETHVETAFSDFESRFYRKQIKELLSKFGVVSILDYGCGGSDWSLENFDESGLSAKDFYNLKKCLRFEPARAIDERALVDCVINFDVLEHIFVADVPLIIEDIFKYAKKLVIINVACYPAAAKLPNGENAHITVRSPFWWKAQIDNIAIKYPNINVQLLTSIGWRKTQGFPLFKAKDWLESKSFVTE